LETNPIVGLGGTKMLNVKQTDGTTPLVRSTSLIFAEKVDGSSPFGATVPAGDSGSKPTFSYAFTFGAKTNGSNPFSSTPLAPGAFETDSEEPSYTFEDKIDFVNPFRAAKPAGVSGSNPTFSYAFKFGA
jgi:hypothetical protein